jgi:hypothetical protein
VFAQGKSYSNSPSFVYHRLDISPLPLPTLHLEVTNKSLDTGSKDCMNSDNVKDEKKIKGEEKKKKYSKNGMYLVGAKTTHK